MADSQASEPGPRGGTRERILEATLRIVAEQGVDAVTHRAVAARAGVSPGSTTHHFSSREDLLREAFRAYLRAGENLFRRVLAIEAHPGEDPVDLLKRQVGLLVEREFAHGLVRAEYELLLFACSDPDLVQDVRVWETRVVGVFAETLESAGVDRPVMSARALLDLLRGYEIERLLDPGLTTADFEDRFGLMVRALGPATDTSGGA